MSKAVLISIQPQWCELIAAGKKTIEVRKSKPNLETPFKAYISQTRLRWAFVLLRRLGFDKTADRLTKGFGKVIGEFVCDAIFPMSVKYSDSKHRLANREYPFTCLTDKQIMDYLGNGKEGYGWHIYDPVIYDEPKPLSNFKKHNRTCYYDNLGLTTPKCADCKGCQIARPPQSWCYVEEAQ